MEPFIGRWKMDSSENFDKYMEAVGIGFVTRKMANSTKPTHVFIANPDGSYTLRAESAVKNQEQKFRLNEEFEEHTPDGRNAKSTLRLEDGKLIQDQKAEVDSVITRELPDPNTLVTKFTANGVTGTRVFKRE